MPLLDLRNLWSPSQISTVAWYDASDASTITESGGNVSQWNDKSGNNRHMTQGNGSNQPKWGVGATINGMPVMHYEGTFDEMFIDGMPDIDVTELAHVTIVEAKTAGDWPALGVVQNTAGTDKLDNRLSCSPTGGAFKHVFNLDGAATNWNSANQSPLAEENPFLCTFWYDGANATVRSNGGQFTDTKDPADGGTFTINKIKVGRESNTPRNYQGEIIILDTSDLATIQLCEGYLAWKWGTQSELPGGHPYKDAAP
jgi:hypothetical protein